MRISAKPLSRRKITSEHPQEDEISIAIPRPSGAKSEGVKPPARGGFTPSKQPAGRSLFEAHLWGFAPYPTRETFLRKSFS
jgi:hypothetical protein